MPLPERLIVPVNVCRGTLQLPVPDELEGVTNGSLANIIRYNGNIDNNSVVEFRQYCLNMSEFVQICVPMIVYI